MAARLRPILVIATAWMLGLSQAAFAATDTQDTLDTAQSDDSSASSQTEARSSDWNLGRAVLPVVSSAGKRLLDTAYIHGFAGEAWGKTQQKNRYLQGDHDGNWDNLEGGLVIGGNVTDSIRLHTQIGFENEDVTLDYMFGEFSFRDWLKVRVGRVSQPFGLYSEILEIGTLRPLYSLSNSVYGDAGLTGESITGMTISGSIPAPAGMLVKYDIYGGLGKVLEGRESVTGGDTSDVDNTLGARLQLETPIDGLLVGMAGYWGKHDGVWVDEIAVQMAPPPAPPVVVRPAGWADKSRLDHGVLGAQLQYLQGPFTLRSEYYHQWEDSSADTDVVCVEGGYFLTENVQLAGRYDYLKTKVHGDFNPPAKALKHTEATVGINYWFAPNAVMRVNYAHVWDNRFANPQDGDFDAANDETDYYSIGFQFSF